MNNIEDDIKCLIFELTGYKNNDHSLEYCCTFMREALCEYVSSPSSTISNKLEVFATKLDYLGFPLYAVQLSNALSYFLRNDKNDEKERKENWAALNLVLQLSNNAFKPDVLSALEYNLKSGQNAIFPEKISEETKINWFKYLQEGSEKYELPDEDDERSDEEYRVISENLSLILRDLTPVTVYSELFDDVQCLEAFVDDENTEVRKTLKEAVNAKSILVKSVQHSWWNGEHCTISQSMYPSANFGRLWKTYESNGHCTNELRSNISYHDEYKIIRELLLILTAVDKRVLNRIELLRTRTSITSLIQETFASVIDDILKTAEKSYALTSFCDEVHEKYALQVSFTLQAYSFAVKDIYREFLTKIIELETVVKKQDTAYTLLTLREDLKEHLRIISFLFDVHNECITTNWMKEVPWIMVVRLLSVLLTKYQEISSKLLRQILLRIFLSSFKIYAKIIDVWLTEGKLNDWKNEFFIQKSEKGERYIAFPNINKRLSETLIISPLFHRLSKKLLNCCQNIDFLCKSNKMRKLKSEILKEGKLIDLFVEQLKQKTQNEKNSSHEISNENYLAYDTFVNFISTHEYIGSISDVPYLVRAFDDQLYISNGLCDSTFLNKSIHVSNEKLEEFDFTFTGPVLEHLLSNLIRKREDVIVSLFKTAIIDDYKFYDHIRNLKSVLLLDWSGFCNRVPIQLGKQTWIDHNIIKVYLYDCIEKKILTLSHLIRFTVCEENDMGNFEVNVSRIIEAIDHICVHYEIQWPLKMIFTDEIVKSFYTPLLRLVLKIKFALSTVTRLQFKDIPHLRLYTEKVRSIQVLRHWVVLLLQKLHSYLLLAISQSLNDEAFEKCLDLQTFIALSESFTSYLNKSKRNCLIESEFFEYLNRALNRIWHVCDDVVSLWADASRLQISDNHVALSIELYSQCLWYMTKVLQKFLHGELGSLYDLWSDLNHMLEMHKTNIPEDLSFQASQLHL